MSGLQLNPGINNQSPPKGKQSNQDAPGEKSNNNPPPNNSNGTDQDNNNSENDDINNVILPVHNNYDISYN